MTIGTDPMLSYLVDEMDSDETQEDLNESLLFEHDRNELIECINHRISKYYILYLIEKTDLLNLDYWKLICYKLAKTYSLNYMKIFYEEMFDIYSIAEIKNTMLYIKIDLINKIENNIIKNTINIDELNDMIDKDVNCPQLFKKCIKYIDNESYFKFIDSIFVEKQLPFME